MKNNINNKSGEINGKKITRKQAIQKAGVTALTTATMFFLDTKKAAATSAPTTIVPTDTEQGAQQLGGRSDGTARPDR